MQWIIIIGNEKFNLSIIEDLEFPGCKEKSLVGDNRILVDYEEGHAFFDYSNETFNDYDDKSVLPFKYPHFVLLIYTSKEILKKIFDKTLFPNSLYIDDDEGSILKIDEYIERLNISG